MTSQRKNKQINIQYPDGMRKQSILQTAIIYSNITWKPTLSTEYEIDELNTYF